MFDIYSTTIFFPSPVVLTSIESDPKFYPIDMGALFP